MAQEWHARKAGSGGETRAAVDSDSGERIGGEAAWRVVTFDFDGHAGEIGTFGKFATASAYARAQTRKRMATALLSHPDEPLRIYARGRLRLRIARR